MPPVSKKTKKVARPVVYNTIETAVLTGPNALTASLARDLLGWEEETDGGEKFGKDYAVVAPNGRKVRMTNNTRNRPLTLSWVETLCQEHLNKRWVFTGETCIIGKTGEVLSAQHRLVGLIFADMYRQAEPAKWKKNWPSEVTMETILVTGVDEDGAIKNVLDTGKPRTLSDVLYISPLFEKLLPADRRTAARCCDNAIKMLWHRTGAMKNAFSPRRTHSESMDFLARHGRIVDAVKHVLDENAENRIGDLLPVGYAAGLMYLMGMSASDPVEYRSANKGYEKKGSTANWDKAAEFWVLLASGAKEFEGVRTALKELIRDDGYAGTVAEKMAVLIHAWNEWVSDGKLTPKNLAPEYSTDGEGNRYLAHMPSVDGIDLGEPEEEEPEAEEVVAEEDGTEATPEDEAGEGPVEHAPTPEEIATEAARIKAEKKKAAKAAKPQPSAETAE